MQSLVDDVVKDVDEGVFSQSVVDLLKGEFESGEALGDFGDEGVGALLVLFVGGNEVVEETKWGPGYGF